MRRMAMVGLVMLLGVACREERKGGAEAVAAPEDERGQAGTETTTVEVWFLDAQRMRTGREPLFVPVQREVSAGQPAREALKALFEGPTQQEAAAGLRLVRSEATGFADLRIENGVARLRLTGGCDSGGSTVTIANAIRPTLKQFPTVGYVKIYDPAGSTETPTGREDSIPVCLEP